MLEAYTKANNLFVPCNACKRFHVHDISEGTELKSHCPPKIERNQIIQPQSYYNITILGEYTQEVARQHLKLWGRKHLQPHEDIF